ncbi:MAG: hypothetical protein KAH18_07625 [Psychromonas sp.]|nr:hypothetical protein [Psychromonas sp.]
MVISKRNLVIASTLSTGGKGSIERRYYITSHSTIDAKFINETGLSHWSVENNLHCQLNVNFDEDNCRLRSGDLVANFLILHKIEFGSAFGIQDGILKIRKKLTNATQLIMFIDVLTGNAMVSGQTRIDHSDFGHRYLLCVITGH